jgi:hypothetical protein
MVTAITYNAPKAGKNGAPSPAATAGRPGGGQRRTADVAIR